MPGPWEDYQQGGGTAVSDRGPWEDYQQQSNNGSEPWKDYQNIDQTQQQPSLTPETDKEWETGAATLPDPEDEGARYGGPSGAELNQMAERSPAQRAVSRGIEKAVAFATPYYRKGQQFAGKAAEASVLANPVMPFFLAEALPQGNIVRTGVEGVAAGVGKTVEGLTSPDNLAIMAAMGLSEGLAVPVVARQAISAAFAYQMASGMPELWKAFKEAPDLKTKISIATEAGANAFMMKEAGQHAIVGEPRMRPGPGYTMGPEPYEGPKPPIQNAAFMLPPPETVGLEEAGVGLTPEGGLAPTTAPETQTVTTGGRDWREVQDRFKELQERQRVLADSIETQRKAGLPYAGGVLEEIARNNEELETLGQPQRGFTADVEPVKTQEELQAERERGRIARARGPQSIVQELGGETDAQQRSDAQMEGRTTPLGGTEGAGGAEAEPGGGDNVVGEAQGAGARGNIPGAQPQPAGERPVVGATPQENVAAGEGVPDVVPGAPDFQQFRRSKAFQKGWTLPRIRAEYQRLYGRDSPENAALLNPQQFEEATVLGPLRGKVDPANGVHWDNAAYDSITDAYEQGKPINKDLWHDIMEQPHGPVGYNLEGDTYQPDLRTKHSIDQGTQKPYSLSDETRKAFQPVERGQENPYTGGLIRHMVLRHGKVVEQVHLPGVSERGGMVGERARNVVSQVEQAAKAYGARVAWYRGIDGPVSTSMGAQFRDTIFLNADMSGGEPIHQVFAHELTHFLEKNHPDLYNRLQYEILRSADNKWLDSRYGQHLQRNYGPAEFHHELTADFMAEALRDPRRFQQMFGDKPTLMQRLSDAINRFVEWSKRKILGTPDLDPKTASSVINNLEKTRRNAMDVFQRARVTGERGVGGFRESRVKPEGTPVPGYEPGFRQPEPMSDEELRGTLDQKKALSVGAHRNLPQGTPVSVRIDIPSFMRSGKYAQTVHGPKIGKNLGYDSIVHLDGPVSFTVRESTAEKIKNKEIHKAPIAAVEGKYNPNRELPNDINDQSKWTPLGFDPMEHSYFYDKTNDQPVIGGDEAIHVGNTVYVKNPDYAPREQFRYSDVKGDISPEEKAKFDAIIKANPVLKDPNFRNETNRWNTLYRMATDAGLPRDEQIKFIREGMKGAFFKPEEGFRESKPKAMADTGSPQQRERARETVRRASQDIAGTNMQRVLDNTTSTNSQAANFRKTLPKELRSYNKFKQIENAVEFFKRNILRGAREALQQPWARLAAKQYQGYNIYSHRIADEFGYSPERVMVAESAMSPNTSPEQSFEATRRLMKMLRDNRNDVFDQKMYDWAKNATTRNEQTGEVSHLYGPKELEYLKGRRFSDIPEKSDMQAMWMRAYDSAHHGKVLRTVRPDGTLGDFDKTPTGKPNSFAFTTFDRMQAGIEALEGVRKPHESLKTAKVANYYMSKLLAFEPSNHVVVDTHHTSLAYGNSLPSGHPLIRSVFGAQRGPHGEFAGKYSIIHEATLRAAKEMGMDPKELQAMVWAYQRGYKGPDSFGRTTEGKQAVKDIQKLWEHAQKGRITEEKANEGTEKIAKDFHGKIPAPAYADGGRLRGEVVTDAGDSGHPAELPSPRGVSSGEPGPGERGDVATGAADEPFRSAIVKNREKYPDSSAIVMPDGRRFEAVSHGHAYDAAERAGYSEADIKNSQHGYMYGGKFVPFEALGIDKWREARSKVVARAREESARRAKPRDLASAEPYVSRFANRYVSEEVKAGKIGEVAPGEGYSTHDLIQLGSKMTPQQIQASIDRVNRGGLDPIVDAAAIRNEAARLSERSTRLSRVADRQPNNRKARQAADAAFKEVTAFHNGPVARLKNAWHGVGMAMQGEHPVDLTTTNGWREEYMRSTKKPITPQVDARLRNGARKFSKVVDAEMAAKEKWINQIDALEAGKMLPSADTVRANIMKRLKLEPC